MTGLWFSLAHREVDPSTAQPEPLPMNRMGLNQLDGITIAT